MLKSLELVNFQCHRNIQFDFAPGVNVIAGRSDVGKSAVLKGLLWLLTNKPQGLGFRNWSCKKGDIMESRIVLGGQTITRRRSESINEYWLDSRKFVAMKSEVPTDIAVLLNMKPINFQTQFAPHFLLASTSSEVARTLNDACDLSIIDKTLKSANSISAQSQTEVRIIDRQLADFRERLDVLRWVQDAESRLAAIEAEEERMEAKKQSAGRLQDLVSELESVESRLVQAPPDFSKELKAAQRAYEVFEQTSVAQRELSRIINELRSIEQEIAELENECAAIKEELAAIWKETPACPLCGRLIAKP